MSQYGMAYVEAMFDGYGICCVSKNAGDTYYRISWSMDKATSAPAWSGDPQEVKISADIQDVKAAMLRRTESAMFAKVLEGDLPDALLHLVCDAAKRHEAVLAKRAQQREEKELEALLVGSGIS